MNPRNSPSQGPAGFPPLLTRQTGVLLPQGQAQRSLCIRDRHSSQSLDVQCRDMQDVTGPRSAEGAQPIVSRMYVHRGYGAESKLETRAQSCPILDATTAA